MESALHARPGRAHLARLRAIWSSAGWPCRDAIEIDLLAAGWIARSGAPGGPETLSLSDAGIRLLASERQRNLRALGPHDRLAQRVARRLMESGRIVWRELSLRAQVDRAAPPAGAPTPPQSPALWPTATDDDAIDPAPAAAGTTTWRNARPDVFSVRNTSVEAYLQPMVHEVKVSRADLLSDLRHAAKRESYQWLCSECHYVFPVDIAEPHEIPEPFGVWTLHGDIDDGRLELVRPARHVPCTLPFAVWLALAKATPLAADADAAQGRLGDPGEAGDGLPIDLLLPPSTAG
ncbi:MAG: hypothetical protein ABIQ60_10810 [Burkholderiaceae bacterium]